MHRRRVIRIATQFQFCNLCFTTFLPFDTVLLNSRLTTNMSSTDNADVAGLMGPELAANVSFTGQYVRSSQIVMLTEMTVYGAYCVLVVMALYAVGIRPERTARIFWLLSALLFTFALVTISIVIDVAGPVKFVETIFIGTSGSPSFTARIGEYVGWTEPFGVGVSVD